MSLHPALPASLIQWIVFCTESSKLSQPGSALTAAALYLRIVATILLVVRECCASEDVVDDRRAMFCSSLHLSNNLSLSYMLHPKFNVVRGCIYCGTYLPRVA